MSTLDKLLEQERAIWHPNYGFLVSRAPQLVVVQGDSREIFQFMQVGLVRCVRGMWADVSGTMIATVPIKFAFLVKRRVCGICEEGGFDTAMTPYFQLELNENKVWLCQTCRNILIHESNAQGNPKPRLLPTKP